MYKIVGSPEEIFKTPFGIDSDYTMFDPSVLKTAPKSKVMADWYRQFIEEQTQQEGRYELFLEWSKISSHVVCLERHNGLLIWYDPQSGQYGDRLYSRSEEDYLDCVMKNGIGLRRIDDKVVNRKMFVRLLKKGQAR